MTQTLDKAGKPIFFPASLALDGDGVIVPMAPEVLAHLADRVALDGAVLFAKRLIGAARKYHHEPRYAAVNRQRLQLARMCLGRLIGDERELVAELRLARATLAGDRAGLIDDSGGEHSLDPRARPFVDELDAQLARIDSALAPWAG